MSTGERPSKISDIEDATHRIKIRGVSQEIEVAVADVGGRGYDTGYAMLVGQPRDNCLVRVQDRDDMRDHSAITAIPNLAYTSLLPMAREDAGVFVYLYKHGEQARMAGGNGIVMQARIHHLVDTEGVSEEEAYKRLGIENRLTYPNTRSFLQVSLGLGAVRLLVSKEDDENTVRKIISTLENQGEGLTVTPVSLEEILGEMAIDRVRGWEESAEGASVLGRTSQPGFSRRVAVVVELPQPKPRFRGWLRRARLAGRHYLAARDKRTE